MEIATAKYRPSEDVQGLIQAKDGVYSSYFEMVQRLTGGEYLVKLPGTSYLFHCTIPSYIKIKGIVSGTTFRAIVKVKGKYNYETVRGFTNTVKKMTVLYGEKVGY